MPAKGVSKYKYEISTNKEPTKFIIYKCTNLVNGKIYIGQTYNKLNNRMSEHMHKVKNNSKRAFPLALNKYGFDNFKWELIDYAIDKDELDKLEIFYIAQCNSYATTGYGYNLTLGGDTGIGYKQTEEQIFKNSQKMKRYFSSKENREKQAISLGSKPFNVYKNHTDELFGTWINVTECARELGLNKATISDCLSNRNKINANYIFIYKDQDTIENRQEKLGYCSNVSYKKFNVYDKNGKFVMEGLNKSECAKTLNLKSQDIVCCLSDKLNSSKGFIFLYQNEDTYELRSQKLSKLIILYKQFNVYTLQNEFIGQYNNQITCAKELSLMDSCISQCLQGKQKYHKGYKFYYIENDPNLTTINSNNQIINKEGDNQI